MFTKTEEYRHESIEMGIEAIKKIGVENNFKIETNEDFKVFNVTDLKHFELVIFLSTTSDVLNKNQENTFKGYINKGGSFMGIYAATDTEYEWEWYNKLVGAYFLSHPNNPNVLVAEMSLVDSLHLSPKHLNNRWKRNDEWYNFKSINPEIKVLLNLD